MKKIEAIIRPHKLLNVKEALRRLDYVGMSIVEIKGAGYEEALANLPNPDGCAPSFVPRIKVELVARDEDVEDILNAIRQAAQTGKVGDGRIFVTNLESVVHIRTGISNKPQQYASTAGEEPDQALYEILTSARGRLTPF